MIFGHGPSDYDRFAYLKGLGWSEFNEDGDRVPAIIVVIDANIGYNVFRMGEHIVHLNWLSDREEAIEWAVDRARDEISIHEIRQAERD